MITTQRKIQAWQDPSCNSENTVYVRLVERSGEGVFYAQPVEFKKITSDGYPVPHPETFRMSPELAQALVNQLWEMGIRATQSAGSAGQLAAVHEHLKDLRALTFHALKVPTKP